MTRQELKANIVSKLTSIERDNWGKGANRIQDIAEQVLTSKDFDKYLRASNRDVNACDGCDFVVFNGQYFDWREFEYNSPIILGAFLDYFTNTNLQKILEAM